MAERLTATMNEFFLKAGNFVSTITGWDIIDIAIVAFLVYKLLAFIRRTNSANVIKGIFLLLLVMGITSVIPLPVVQYLLGNAFEVGLLAVIVLFQPEIRGILERVGSTGGFSTGIFGKSVSNTALQNAITQVVLACTDMSESRTGALIVFERAINLEAYIKTGTIIDAAPAADLIKNIFFDKASLHDGAVIIRGGRIAGAACMLPLSGNNNISRDLGMRHRAGIGMSERSDAIVVIVSEETGSISVATEGMLKRHLDPKTLERLLMTELLPKEPQKGLFRQIKAKNGGGE